MKKILVLVLISAVSVFAQTAGNTGVSFLKNGFGARNIAMSDLGVVGINDLTALNYNPALLADYQNPQIMLTHIQSIQDMSTQLVGASFSLFGLPFAIGVNNTTISELEVRTIASEVPQSTFNAHYMFGSLSTGINVLENISVGATAKYVYENLLSDESSGYVFDFGVSYKSIIEGLNFGASLKNIGSLSELRNEVTKLPTDFRAGASYNFNLQEISSVVRVIGGVQKYIDTDDTHIHAGAEVFYDNLIAIRLGYMSGYESKGLTAGLGVYWHGINFDYAFTPYSYGLGTGHTISLMYSFN
ncbi:MAG: PorV/PorQ family protein [Bacteroidetes bacterium]|nr:PorV/PorQ family protein [Bacteroidota bacterium]MBU1115816.1 PorV/PorQ family protein [Bacteroidota bacterium]MBU1800209.1 PorV/PorQ family protein [Bacteroidota bacterium]